MIFNKKFNVLSIQINQVFPPAPCHGPVLGFAFFEGLREIGIFPLVSSLLRLEKLV